MKKPSIEIIESVLNEYVEIALKLEKIYRYMANVDSQTQSHQLLHEQICSMEKYRDALRSRLNLWGIM